MVSTRSSMKAPLVQLEVLLGFIFYQRNLWCEVSPLRGKVFVRKKLDKDASYHGSRLKPHLLTVLRVIPVRERYARWCFMGPFC